MQSVQTQLFLSRKVGQRFCAKRIKFAHAWLVSRLRRPNLASLTFNPQDKPAVSQAKMILLMWHAVRSKFAHLYTLDGAQVSEAAYDKSVKCRKMLEDFPDFLAQEGFQIASRSGRLQIAASSGGLNLDVVVESKCKEISNKMAEILRLAVIKHVYEWCMKEAGDNPRSYQMTFDPKRNRPTLDTTAVKRLMSSFIKALGKLNEHSPPEVFFAIKYLLICNRDKLPFNIQIPF